MKMIKIVAIVASLLMALMMAAPTFAVKGPITDHLMYKFYTEDALFAGLLNGEIDFMAWPLTSTQYDIAKATLNITVAPYFETGAYEIAFNNNATDPSHMADRKAMNYTEFRRAMACLIDKDGLIAGPTVNGFATRIDTPIARPNLDTWVNFGVSKYASDGSLLNNYPWDYNTTKALEILWTNNWFSHTTYPTLTSLLTAYAGGPLPVGSVKYPPGHPRAGTAIDTIIAYVRTHLPRKQAGDSLCAEMIKLGITVSETVAGSSVCYNAVYVYRDYDFYTSGWSYGARPLHFYSMFTPVGIYSGGSNLYQIDDANLTVHAELQYPFATSGPQSISEAKICQEIIVDLAGMVPLFTNAAYIAYKTGTVGALNFRGYGLTTALEYTFMNAKTAPYSSPMTLIYGTYNPPISVNPIFSSWVWDYEVVDRIFNSPMASNPFKPSAAGKSPVGGDQPWMAYDWNFQLSNFTGGGGLGNSSISYTNMANVTYWFRHDITWQDGVPFTVDDFNYTIFINAAYGDSWGFPDMVTVVNFVKWDDWTCSVYFEVPTFYTVYTTMYNIVPKHIYQYIGIPADAKEGTSLSGLHGEWPGKNSLESEILSGAPFTHAQLTGADGGKYVWVGTGMWKYVPGTYVSGVGGGLVCDPYLGFWMNMTQGEIDFTYFWDAGAPPQGGRYRIGLPDLVLLANAYATDGRGALPFKLGGLHVWEPCADIAPPAGIVGLSDLVTLALNYGKTWGSNP